jgi:hypothetical protein
MKNLSKASTFNRINVIGGAWAGAVLSVALGVLLLWWGFRENQKHWLLSHYGQRTLGDLEKVTRTRHSVNFIPTGSTYSFDVSFQDKAGAPCHLHSEVNAHLLAKYTSGKETFIPHAPIEVVFLPNDSKISGLPEMLGVSVGLPLIGGLCILGGTLSCRNLLRPRKTPKNW